MRDRRPGARRLSGIIPSLLRGSSERRPKPGLLLNTAGSRRGVLLPPQDARGAEQSALEFRQQFINPRVNVVSG